MSEVNQIRSSEASHRLYSASLARQILSQYWGMDACLKRLGAEKDAIYRVSHSEQFYVLRLSHPELCERSVSLQIAAAMHASSRLSELHVPVPVADNSGRYIVPVAIETGQVSQVSLSTWIDGRLLVDTQSTDSQARNLGFALGVLSEALADFDHDQADHYMKWDLRRCGEIETLLPAIEDTSERGVVHSALDWFVTDTAEKLEKLPRQIIHADATPYNVLSSNESSDEIAGFIDFGDVVRSARVCDVAIAACYLLGDGDNAFHLPSKVVEGFHAARRLQSDELELIASLIEARHAMTAAITLEHAARRPENKAAITKNTGIALKGLKTLSRQPHDYWTEQLMTALATESSHE